METVGKFQKSDISNRFKVKFTINLRVVGKAEYAEARDEASYLPRRPTPNVLGGPGWWERIGLVLPDRRDRWWTIAERDRTDQVAQEVLQAIEAFAVPAMRAHMALT